MKYWHIALLLGVSVFFIALSIFAIRHRKPRTKNENKEYEKPEAWLYSNLMVKLYDAIFGDRDPATISKKFGLEYDKYMINCNIVGKSPNMKKECMMRIIGVASFFIGAFASLISFSPYPAIIGSALYLLLVSANTHKVANEAEKKKSALILGFPRFLDMLSSGLEADLPIEIALAKVVEHVPCVLSAELKTSIAQMQVGAINWQQALENVAYKYEVDILSDFVLDVVTSHNKGIPVAEAVARKSYMVKQSALLRSKEKVAKMSTSILFPIVVFKIIPLLAIMLIPIVIQIFSGF